MIGSWLWLLQQLCVNIAAIISSTEAINCKGTEGTTLAGNAVTAEYATAAVYPLIGN